MGNKCDRTADKAVTEEQAKEFADELGIAVLETSAKSSKNVEEAFLTMAGELVRQRAASGNNGNDSKKEGIDLNNTGKEGMLKKCCWICQICQWTCMLEFVQCIQSSSQRTTVQKEI